MDDVFVIHNIAAQFTPSLEPGLSLFKINCSLTLFSPAQTTGMKDSY
jgi:hypothetical protein